MLVSPQQLSHKAAFHQDNTGSGASAVVGRSPELQEKIIKEKVDIIICESTL